MDSTSQWIEALQIVDMIGCQRVKDFIGGICVFLKHPRVYDVGYT